MYGGRGYMRTLLIAQFCSEPKIAYKIKVVNFKKSNVKDSLLLLYNFVRKIHVPQYHLIHLFCFFLWKINYFTTKKF